MKETSPIQQLRNTLKSILQRRTKGQIQIALLKSFKESLKMALSTQQKKALFKKAVEVDNKYRMQKQDASITILHSTESTFKKHSRIESYSCAGQLKQLKMIIVSVCRQYDYRTQLNSRHYELQQLYHKTELQKLRSSLRDGQKQGYQHKTVSKINRELSSLLTQFIEMGKVVRLQYENIQDMMRLLRVKYILQKERRGTKKATASKQQKGEEKHGTNCCVLNDENKNQHLVNL